MTDPPPKPRYREPFVSGRRSAAPKPHGLDPLFAIAFRAACPLVPIEAALAAVRSFDGFRPETGAVANVGAAWAQRLAGWEAVWPQLSIEAKLVAFAFAWISAFERRAADGP